MAWSSGEPGRGRSEINRGISHHIQFRLCRASRSTPHRTILRDDALLDATLSPLPGCEAICYIQPGVSLRYASLNPWLIAENPPGSLREAAAASAASRSIEHWPKMATLLKFLKFYLPECPNFRERRRATIGVRQYTPFVHELPPLNHSLADEQKLAFHSWAKTGEGCVEPEKTALVRRQQHDNRKSTAGFGRRRDG
jgi:hypothetical protein